MASLPRRRNHSRRATSAGHLAGWLPVWATAMSRSSGDAITGTATREGERSGGAGSGCVWESIDGTGGIGGEVAGPAQTTNFADGRSYALFRKRCNGSDALIWVPQLTVQGDLLPAAIDEMTRRLHYPEPVFEPLDADFGWSYVQVPLDFRTTEATWQPIVVTAEVDGPPGSSPWVTITAEPTELWFSSGDPTDPGPVAACGTADAIAPYVAETPGACSYVYRNASTTVDGDTFAAELGIVWDVTYESSDGPGTLTVDPTVTPAPVQVAEIKALVTCTGPDPRQGSC